MVTFVLRQTDVTRRRTWRTQQPRSVKSVVLCHWHVSKDIAFILDNSNNYNNYNNYYYYNHS